MSEEWPRYYVLLDRTPMAVDMLTWAESIEKRIRSGANDPWRVDRTQLEGCYVSTVFLGIDHQFGRGEPVLFETMIFGGPLDGDMYRYGTYEQAERGHAAAVTKARIAGAKVKALADAAGAKQ